MIKAWLSEQSQVLHWIHINIRLRHCINSVFILHKNHINPSTFIFEWNNKIIKLSLDCPLLIMSVNRKWTGFQPGSQISTGNRWQRYQKSILFQSGTLYNIKWSSQCNLTDQIEQVQDNICIYVYSTSYARLRSVLIAISCIFCYLMGTVVSLNLKVFILNSILYNLFEFFKY